MSRLTANARRWCFVALLAWPVLAQTQGCLGSSTTEVREMLSTTVTQVISAGTTFLISNAVNEWLNVPTGFF